MTKNKKLFWNICLKLSFCLCSLKQNRLFLFNIILEKFYYFLIRCYPSLLAVYLFTFLGSKYFPWYLTHYAHYLHLVHLPGWLRFLYLNNFSAVLLRLALITLLDAPEYHLCVYSCIDQLVLHLQFFIHFDHRLK